MASSPSPALPPEIQAVIDLFSPEGLEKLAAQKRAAAPAAPTPEPTPRYLSVPAYAKRSGYSAPTIRKWIKEGLPHTNAPGHVRVIVAEADAWVQHGPGATRPGLRAISGGKP